MPRFLFQVESLTLLRDYLFGTIDQPPVTHVEQLDDTFTVEKDSGFYAVVRDSNGNAVVRALAEDDVILNSQLEMRPDWSALFLDMLDLECAPSEHEHVLFLVKFSST